MAGGISGETMARRMTVDEWISLAHAAAMSEESDLPWAMGYIAALCEKVAREPDMALLERVTKWADGRTGTLSNVDRETLLGEFAQWLEG